MDIRTIAYKSPDYERMIQLRYNVLRKPLSLQLTEQELVHDAPDDLLGCFDGEDIVGCCILHHPGDGWIKLRQFAVADARQGQGIGRALLEKTYALTRQSGCSKMFCHARDTAKGFYEKNGWKITGDPFDAVGIKHYRMEIFL